MTGGDDTVGDENVDDSVSMSTSQRANKSCVHHTNARKSLRIVMLTLLMVRVWIQLCYFIHITYIFDENYLVNIWVSMHVQYITV